MFDGITLGVSLFFMVCGIAIAVMILRWALGIDQIIKELKGIREAVQPVTLTQAVDLDDDPEIR